MRHPAKALALLVALLAGLLLSACTITSDKLLVTDEELAAPLPDAFTFFPYESDDTGYVRSTDAPAHFAREDQHYVASDLPDTKGSLDVRFVPVGDEVYLMAATVGDEASVVYGFARYTDGVLSIALSPDAQTATAISKAHLHAMPQARRALAGIKVSGSTDEITVKSRTALDYLADMYVAGRLPMDKLSVGYIALDPDATPPSRLIRAGHNWVRVP